MQKDFAGIIFLTFGILIIILILSYIFIARPYKISGNQVAAPFKNGEIVFSEKISYLFSKPIVNDRVIFKPQDKEIDFVGIVTKAENQDNVTTYTILSAGKGQTWVVSADKITGKIYYPFKNKEEIKLTSTLAQCELCKDSWGTTCSGNSNCVVPEGSSQGVCLPVLKMGQNYTINQINNLCSTNFPESTLANWKTYENNNLGVSFKYPSDWSLLEYNDFVAVVKDPDFRMILGACPGYSFGVKKFESKENYQIYQPIKQSIFKDQKADIYENTNKYGCYTKVIYINQYPTENIKPRLIISMTTKNPSSKLFDKILSTLKFTNQAEDSIEGRPCGGFAGDLPENKCPTGYSCQMNNGPDTGKCIKN